MHNHNGNEKNFDDLFWADQLAKQITSREKFHYTENKIPKLDEFVVKTSASLSGVLHIGRLSDTIRGESVVLALKDQGVKTRFIWVAENMDPLRKIPKGVPDDFEKYLGMAVTDIPDPKGCHSSYAEHHMDEYFQVVDQFVTTKMEKFSMRDEYKKGSFNPYIKKIMEKIEVVKEIQNRYRTNPLKKGWSPWTPICENCGKIVTPRIIDFQNGKAIYECTDYEFETTTATGCGHKGENDPLKGQGKLLWKSEWASQWARWQVVCEGAGKEYQVPNSAWWINGEIVEKVHEFPMPVPIFYEHIMIENQKMSASVGNVVYPKDWLEVAAPNHLRLFYNKRLMTTRSFSWKDLPVLYDEYDKMSKIYLGKIKVENEKEEAHYKRLLEISTGNKIEEPVEMSFSHASMIAQISNDEEDMIKSLQKTGHWNESAREKIFERIRNAKVWLKKYAPDEVIFEVQKHVHKDVVITESEKEALHIIANELHSKEFNEKTLFEEFYNVSQKVGIKAPEFFKAAYKVLLNRERGPKLAPFVLALGKEKAAKLLESV